ncbi:hypothetical protein ACIVBQ_000423 [Tenacibaculum discolor]
MKDFFKKKEVNSVNESDESANKKTSSKKVKVKILLPVAGKFSLSANVGDEIEYPEPLATDLIEAKYAEKV